MSRTPHRQGRCYVARGEIDALLARAGGSPALLQSLRADAELLRAAAGLARTPESARIDEAIVAAVRAGVHPALDRGALEAAAAQAARTGRTRERVISLHLDTLRRRGRIAYIAKRWEIRE